MQTTFRGPLVFVDVETNGMSAHTGHVIEVGAIRVEAGQIVDSFNQLIDPGVPLPSFITHLTGIEPEDLDGAPSFATIADELHALLDGALFIAHNVSFDYSFLQQEFQRVGQLFEPPRLCTVRLSRALYPTQVNHKLETLIQQHHFAAPRRHRAYDDAHVLWQFLQRIQQTFPTETVQAAIAKQLRGWPAV